MLAQKKKKNEQKGEKKERKPKSFNFNLAAKITNPNLFAALPLIFSAVLLIFLLLHICSSSPLQWPVNSPFCSSCSFLYILQILI